MFCHYSLFNHGFKFQGSVCNGCHDLPILSVNTSDIAIISIKDVDYGCIIHYISKSEKINLLNKSALVNRGYMKENIALIFGLLKI